VVNPPPSLKLSTPFLVHLAQSYIGSVCTGGNGENGFLALNVPVSQPIATKFGTHILGKTRIDIRFFSRSLNSPKSKNGIFNKGSKIHMSKTVGDFFRQIFSICSGGGSPKGAVLKLRVGPKLLAWGGAKFLIGPRAAPLGVGTVHYRPAVFSVH